MAILKFILFIVLFYYLAKSLVRIFFPILLKNFDSKINDSFQNKSKEGEVKIKYTKKNQKIDKNIGEYTDFEEVKDE
ncbi:MAG: hypothetical protein JXR51_07525 [Bacteroidales bacterium]|nr:hypothetical protein [Bacteroidales bacterium]